MGLTFVDEDDLPVAFLRIAHVDSDHEAPSDVDSSDEEENSDEEEGESDGEIENSDDEEQADHFKGDQDDFMFPLIKTLIYLSRFKVDSSEH